MMTTTGDRTSMRHVTAVESVGILSLFLLFTCRAHVIARLRVRAVGELHLFACDVDASWETLWRSRATPEALLISSGESRRRRSTRNGWPPVMVPPPLHPRFYLPHQDLPRVCKRKLSSTPGSSASVQAQAVEAITGHVLPDLDPVRPFITDSKAVAVKAARATKVKLVRAALEAELLRILGADDCRHTFVQSDVFIPGIDNFLCACGMLVGYDCLDKSESPAHVLAAQLQRFPLLHLLIYFDTACQLARNTSRRIPSLINMSASATSVDRVHNTGNQNKCSDIFDADRYPSRSVTHTTSVAESRHAINKMFSAHLSHLRQDHFIVQMWLLAGITNARVIMRRTQRKETHHRLLCTSFHSNIQDCCERRVCSCVNWQWQDNGRLSQHANGPAPGDTPGDGPGEGRARDVEVAGEDAI